MAKAKKDKVVQIPTKKVQTKAHVSDYAQFENRNPTAPFSTQTVSNKKLIKALLHSIGCTLGKSEPIANNSANEHIANKIKQRMAA